MTVTAGETQASATVAALSESEIVRAVVGRRAA